jgi:anti-sigma regulatory factor (Ser/Thr protein kinase)
LVETLSVPYLEVRLTKKLERVYDLGPQTLVGRAPECQVQLLSRAVSRRHALFEAGPIGVAVQDLGAPNGIKVNGAKIESQSTRPLAEGDQLVVGDVPMIIHLASRAIAAGQSLDLRSMDVAEDEILEHLAQPRAAVTLPNDPAYLSDFQANIARRRIEQLALSPEARLKLQIALAEAIENAITHGAGGNPQNPIQVIFEETPDEVRLTVRDRGPGFDWESVLANASEIDAVAAVRDRESFGPHLGLRMILDCVDRLQFDAGGPGTTIHMAKYKDEDAGMLVIEDDEPQPPSDDHEPQG